MFTAWYPNEIVIDWTENCSNEDWAAVICWSPKVSTSSEALVSAKPEISHPTVVIGCLGFAFFCFFAGLLYKRRTPKADNIV